MESRVEGLISMLHEVTDKSVAVGFGISAPDAVCALADLPSCVCRVCGNHMVLYVHGS